MSGMNSWDPFFGAEQVASQISRYLLPTGSWLAHYMGMGPPPTPVTKTDFVSDPLPMLFNSRAKRCEIELAINFDQIASKKREIHDLMERFIVVDTRINSAFIEQLCDSEDSNVYVEIIQKVDLAELSRIGHEMFFKQKELETLKYWRYLLQDYRSQTDLSMPMPCPYCDNRCKPLE